jgi:hypothetical protein
MKRKLVLPPLQCWSDRYWNMLEGGRFPGVRADAQPLPFHCPFDHLFDNEKWAHSDAPIRECVQWPRLVHPPPTPKATPFAPTAGMLSRGGVGV